MVFIVLVNYNGAEDTEACIRSLQSVPSPDFHVVVVDNGSGEDSLLALRALREELPFTLLEAGENQGFAAGCNAGIRYALENGADQVAGIEIFYVPSAVILHKVSATVQRHSAQTAPYLIRSRYLLIQKRLPAPSPSPAAAACA